MPPTGTALAGANQAARATPELAPWHRGPLLAIDTETTGVDPREARVVTAAAAWLAPDSPPDVSTWLMDPGVPIPDGAAAVHGITTGHAEAHGRPAPETLVEIAAILDLAIAQQVPLVAFNAPFDLTLLSVEFARHGIDSNLAGALVVDPLVLDRHVVPIRPGRRTLEAACAHYRVRLDAAHDAAADALGAARVAWRIAETFPQLQVPLEQLHAAQVGWRAEQADALAEEFAERGFPRHVERDWPLLGAAGMSERLD